MATAIITITYITKQIAIIQNPGAPAGMNKV